MRSTLKSIGLKNGGMDFFKIAYLERRLANLSIYTFTVHDQISGILYLFVIAARTIFKTL